MRILVVEDEKRLATALKRGLEAEGFSVDVALDGRTGLWMGTENSYDAVVLDVMLPHMNGFQVCRRLRDAGKWAPILMLTAKDGELDEAEALDTGADDFLSKPFSYVVLVARLRALLRRGGRERPTVIRIGDLEIDPATHTCRRGDVAIDLTQKEFSILEYLARRSGEVISKTELLEHAWDFAHDGDLNTVEVHLSNLRRKIDRPFGRITIHTVRGVGYRIIPDAGVGGFASDFDLSARTTVVAVTTVMVALVIGAVALVAILRASLHNGADSVAATRAQDVASLIRSGALPPSLAFPGEESTIIQVVDSHGVVIATTANFVCDTPLSTRPGTDPATLFSLRAMHVESRQSERPCGEGTDTSGRPRYSPAGGHHFRVAALSVDTADGTTTIYSGEPTDSADATVAKITALLLIGTPVVALIVGLVTWRNARRALEPVHRIIAEVDAMGEGAHHARLAQPGTHDEIDELATTMNAMLDRLDRLTERQRHFTGDASHELRSPLASLRTQIEVAVAHPAGVDLAVIGAELLADVDRLERLASDLLALARLDHTTVQHTTIDIRSVINDELAATTPTRSIRCYAKLPAEAAMVRGDRRQLQRVLRNLLDNAERYATSNIEIRVIHTDNHVVIEVIDDGPGIALADRQRIFERFTRLDEARATDHGGAGLGLAIVDEIIHAHHGTIHVTEPQTGQGARFVVELPKGPDG